MYCRYCGGVCVKDGVLGISCSTILARIRKIADEICAPPINVGSEYEVDEMWTFLKNKHKPLWIAYALDRNSVIST